MTYTFIQRRLIRDGVHKRTPFPSDSGHATNRVWRRTLGRSSKIWFGFVIPCLRTSSDQNCSSPLNSVLSSMTYEAYAPRCLATDIKRGTMSQTHRDISTTSRINFALTYYVFTTCFLFSSPSDSRRVILRPRTCPGPGIKTLWLATESRKFHKALGLFSGSKKSSHGLSNPEFSFQTLNHIQQPLLWNLVQRLLRGFRLTGTNV